MNKFVVLLIIFLSAEQASADNYQWHISDSTSHSMQSQISTPPKFKRTEVEPNSFAHWLRYIPVKELASQVHTYSGKLKMNQKAHHAIIDIDVGNKDLQQCADAVIRLRAEYLYTMNKYDDIKFNFTSGDSCSFRMWIEGHRPYVSINKVKWKESEEKDSSYQTFRNYLDTVFMYAGSYSLEQELIQKHTIANIAAGDVFIQGGFPGHAVIVVDVAEEVDSGKRMFLLAQSFMPAQDVHILVNPNNSALSPWYPAKFGNVLKTPEWVFTNNDLYSFK